MHILFDALRKLRRKGKACARRKKYYVKWKTKLELGNKYAQIIMLAIKENNNKTIKSLEIYAKIRFNTRKNGNLYKKKWVQYPLYN